MVNTKRENNLSSFTTFSIILAISITVNTILVALYYWFSTHSLTKVLMAIVEISLIVFPALTGLLPIIKVGFEDSTPRNDC